MINIILFLIRNPQSVIRNLTILEYQNSAYMLKLNELKEGDIVMVDFEGQMRVGDVTEVSKGDKKAKVAHGENEFWYELDHVYAVPADEPHLLELGFIKVLNDQSDGDLYERGPFSLQVIRKGEDNHYLLHYRDETRHIHDLSFLHQLQHHYKAMTNFELTWQ
jgi:hypothetical protein